MRCGWIRGGLLLGHIGRKFTNDYRGSESGGSLIDFAFNWLSEKRLHVGCSGRFWRKLARAQCPARPIAAATAQGHSTLVQLPEQFNVAPLVADPTA